MEGLIKSLTREVMETSADDIRFVHRRNSASSDLLVSSNISWPFSNFYPNEWLIRLTKFTLYNHIALITCVYDRKIKFTKNTVGKFFQGWCSV